MRYKGVLFLGLLMLVGAILLSSRLDGPLAVQAGGPSAGVTPGPGPGPVYSNVWVRNTPDYPLPVTAPVASHSFEVSGTLVANVETIYPVQINGAPGTLNVSLISLQASLSTDVQLLGSNVDFHVAGGAGNGNGLNQLFTLSERVPVSTIRMFCTGADCRFRLDLVGD